MTTIAENVFAKYSTPQRQSKLGILVLYVDAVVKLIKQWGLVIIPLFISADNKTFIITSSFIFVILISAINSFLAYHHFTFSFKLKKNELLIHKGILRKVSLSIPLERIQQVNINESLMHRLLSLAEVKMDTAGSDSEEVKIRVVSKKTANELKQLVGTLRKTGEIQSVENRVAESNVKLKISLKSLIKSGLTSNYIKTFGSILAFVFWIRNYLDSFKIEYKNKVSLFLESLDSSFLEILIYFLSSVVIVLLFNLVLTVVIYFNFSIVKKENSILFNYGLFTTKSAMISSNKVQLFLYSQNWIQKKINIFNLKIRQASSKINAKKEKIYIPGCTQEDKEMLFNEIYTSPIKEEVLIKPTIRKFYYNFFSFSLLPVFLFVIYNEIIPLLKRELSIPLILIYIALTSFIIWRRYKNSALFISPDYIRKQEGFWDISTKIIETYKVQSVCVNQKVWQKKLDIGNIYIYTAGGYIALKTARFSKLKTLVNSVLFKVESSEKTWM